MNDGCSKYSSNGATSILMCESYDVHAEFERCTINDKKTNKIDRSQKQKGAPNWFWWTVFGKLHALLDSKRIETAKKETERHKERDT